jgi:hypothetical protein
MLQRHKHGSGTWDPGASANQQLCANLATLYEAPPGTAEATIGLFPSDLRAQLVDAGLIEPVPIGGSDAVEIHLTNRGRAAIADCWRRTTQTRATPAVRIESPVHC